jgi:hypothetical protein
LSSDFSSLSSNTTPNICNGHMGRIFPTDSFIPPLSAIPLSSLPFFYLCSFRVTYRV